jgi:hypothetical protein
MQGLTMYHQQRDFTLPAQARTTLREFPADLDPDGHAGTSPTPKRYFAWLLEALHESRRLQAARVIRRHRHLVAKGHDFETADRTLKPNDFSKGDTAMASTDHARVQRPNKSLSLRAWVLITIIGFAALHVAGGIILLHASNSPPTQVSPVDLDRD